jgi:tetraacyldisaccharide 4'-kinase
VAGRSHGVWPGVQRAALQAASLPYGWAVGCRNWLYDRGWKQIHPAPVPVVSVGNLTLGGTGKTPCVEYVARFFCASGLRVAILSRGYASDGGRNDEALVLEQNLPDVPHLQGADRVALAGAAVEELESEVLVLDDGFQHRRLKRDLDIVLIDATNPWGYGYLFPRGLLRESRRSLRRAGAIVFTRCDQVQPEVLVQLRRVTARYARTALIAETVHRPMELGNSAGKTAALNSLQDRPVSAFCGIGNPDAFRATLRGLKANPNEFRVFPDHYAYTRADVEDLRTWAAKQPDDCAIVTTQKDLVKLRVPALGGRPLWALRIQMEFAAGKELLDAKLNEVVTASR